MKLFVYIVHHFHEFCSAGKKKRENLTFLILSSPIHRKFRDCHHFTVLQLPFIFSLIPLLTFHNLYVIFFPFSDLTFIIQLIHLIYLSPSSISKLVPLFSLKYSTYFLSICKFLKLN